jgi:NAD(P)H-hydrate epimerase
MKLVTSELMRSVDREAIDGRGIPSLTLMENAGRGIAQRILQIHPEIVSSRVAVFAGKGNNGGDGFVIARHLAEGGCDMAVYYVGPPDKMSDDAVANFNRLDETDAELYEITSADSLPSELDADFAVDAIFGTGFSGAPRGITADVIEYMNRIDAVILSVDMPSGLDADTGQYEGAVVQAEHTFTLALPKYGLFVSPGRELAGKVDIIPIGIPEDVVESFELDVELVTSERVSDMLPHRKPDGHKGDFGKVMILAGSVGMTGAATMVGESALRCGTGLCFIACPREVQPVIAIKITEATTHPLPDVRKKGALALRALGEVRTLMEQYDALVIGPGIGRHHETQELIRRLVPSLTKPAIIDADGLNALAGHTDILSEAKVPLVLTPHPGEFARLTGASVSNDIHDRLDAARDFAQKYGVVMLLKGSPTVIADPVGTCYVNPTGNSGMGTGGSGDVLSGAIGSFLGQGMSAIDAAVAAAFVHGLAGDLAAGDLTQRAIIAGDIIVNLPEAFMMLGSD